MYLTYRKTGVRFQIAVPADLHPWLGPTPIRVPLGAVSAAVARRAARLLSGHAERLFMTLRQDTDGMTSGDPRDRLIAELQAQLDALLHEHRVYREMSERLLAVETETARVEGENAVMAQVAPIGVHLGVVADGMQALEAKIRTLPRRAQADVGETLALLQSQIAALSGTVQLSLDGGPVRPLLSEALREWIDVREDIGITDKKVKMDKSRVKDFIEFAGDKPANKYTYFDIQRFASLLVRVPSTHWTAPHLRDKTQLQAADHNDRLPTKDRLPTLSVKSIEDNYLSPLRMFFRATAAQHSFRSPFEGVDIHISKHATPPVERQPFSVAELNLWFEHAARQDRAEMKWLPLLASITGARIAELIYLQGKDIYQMKGTGGEFWVLDLRTDIATEDGGAAKRKIKNKTSRRLIAIHEIFVTVGFIEYAQSRKADDWLFPAAFWYGKRRVADPADAASKRMNRMLDEVGIHVRLEKVFHSSRHSAKDIMRLARVDERTHDLQTGHAMATPSKKYGSKILVQQEVEVLASLPLPDGLDLSPYIDRA
ncbi:site-specific integrase [Agrobacterium tumefaciens]|uniref:site-specific integrase n=2 Tax=Agrobacterium tumefaciens TaxID=358 RepID=UPI001573947B|nr:site-specific integrase [Agrobacterium tumefaciens]NTE56093.1 site-specific integrase [Agrobacterium tumefaciens]NTE74197.1 site-specific integrase [Agrobacterium tumefaciens]